MSRKEVSFSYGNLRLFRINFEYRILKTGLFRRVKNLCKSNQTRYGVSHVYLESNAEGSFAIALLGQKLEFHTEICVYFNYLISKYRIFHRVKELSKSNQIRYGEYHVYLDCNAKGIFALALLEKS